MIQSRKLQWATSLKCDLDMIDPSIYRALVEMYSGGVANKYTGSHEKNTIMGIIERRARRGLMTFTVRGLRDVARGSPVFSTARNMTMKLREEILPELELSGFIKTDGDVIHFTDKLTRNHGNANI